MVLKGVFQKLFDQQLVYHMSIHTFGTFIYQQLRFVCGGGDGRSVVPLEPEGGSWEGQLQWTTAVEVLNSAELLNLHGNWEGLQPMASPRDAAMGLKVLIEGHSS